MWLILDLAEIVRLLAQLFSFYIATIVGMEECSNVRELVIFSSFGQIRKTLNKIFQEMIRVAFEGACLIIIFYLND